LNAIILAVIQIHRTILMTQKSSIHLLIVFLFLGPMISTGVAQQPTPSTISVQASGEVEIPANLIQFHVNITQFHTDPKEAFTRHKELENFLTDLILEEDISERHITANPISISQTRRQQEGTGFETRQQVSIRIDDVTQFENMQLTLIENGFTNFSGNFSSTNISEAQDEALDKAVREAYRKAGILAKASGKSVGQVVSLEYGTTSDVTPRTRGLQVAFESADRTLLEFERMLSIREQVFVVFRISE